MTLRMIALMATACLSVIGLQAQDKDPVLFSVEGHPVHRSEFVYIYEKTNGKSADYSRKSLDEYLDLYVKFKLKVQRAREMRLDTIPALKRELEGYRRQLADSYLIDKEVTDKLTREAYERSRQDVDISHILIAVAPNASPADTLAAYQRAMAARKRIAGGEDFAKVAREVSEDKSAEKNDGHIGFVTALFPNGFYSLETAAYTLPVGQVSQPVHTNAGYHLLLVHARRPARGEVEAAHILLRTKDKDPVAVKASIDSIYQALQGGASFEDLARKRSQDGFTAEKGGYVGFIGINRFEKPFEDAAFSITTDGGISAPFQTSIGWHIIKRISKRDIQPYDKEQRRLEELVKKDARHEIAQQAMIERVKREAGFTQNEKVLQQFIDTLSDDFLTFRWKAPEPAPTAELFHLGKDRRVSLGEFTNFLAAASRQRTAMGRETDRGYAVRTLYNDFVNQTCMKYQEAHLEEKYPDFRYLMREYEEGILLFEATQNEVWNKASQDSTGLADFFEKVKSKYRWDDRAQISNYRLSATAKDKLDEVRAFVETHNPEEVLAHFNTDDNIILSVEERMLERTKNDIFIGVPWRVGALSPAKANERNQSLNFFKIEEIMPASEKTLDEARGYVIAEYQDYLEQEWVKDLRQRYKVTMSPKVLDAMVK